MLEFTKIIITFQFWLKWANINTFCDDLHASQVLRTK
jgi:hypothetical protein